MTLLKRDPNAPVSWQGELPVTNRYTYGLAGEKFFRALKSAPDNLLGSERRRDGDWWGSI